MSDETFVIAGKTDQDVIDAIAYRTAASDAPPASALFGRSKAREAERMRRHREKHRKNAAAVVPDALDYIRWCTEPGDLPELSESGCADYCAARARERSGVVGFVLSPFWIGVVIRIALLVIRIWLKGGLAAWTEAEAERQKAKLTT